METKNQVLTVAGVIGAGILVAGMFLNPFKVIESGYVGVKSTFGKFDPQELPWMKGAYRFRLS